MARSLPKVRPFLVTVDLKLKWPELPRGPNYPALPYTSIVPAATCACLVTKGHSSTAFLSFLQSISSMEDVPEKWGCPSGESVPFVSVSGALSFRGECPRFVSRALSEESVPIVSRLGSQRRASPSS